MNCKFLNSKYTNKFVYINSKSISQEILQQQDFKDFLKNNQTKLLVLENFSVKELLLYLKNVKRYQSIFVEDNLLGKELVDENFDGEAKPDLLIVFFRKNVIKPEDKLKQFPNFV